MNKKSLWKLSIETTPDSEEAITEMLRNRFGEPVYSYTDAEKRVTTVMQLFAKPPERFGGKRIQLRETLTRIRACGLNVGSGTISLRKILNQDWANSWKRHFKPIQIGSALLIKPPWSLRRARTGQSVVVLNPGLSFGTGQHPTTAFCLRQIVASCNSKREQSFLDIGTGSGILAIAAAKLGYTPIEALDLDPDAIRITRANARRNRVLDRIEFRRADLAKLPAVAGSKYDLICANLISTLLIEEQRRILSRLAPGGMLVLAGILRSEFPVVQESYEEKGLKLIAQQTENEWQSGAFVQNGPKFGKLAKRHFT